MLHELASGIDGVLVVSVFNAALPTDKGIITHHRVGDVDGMVDAIMAHASTDHMNVYSGLQVMRSGLGRGKRGTESDIVAVLGLVADMDGDTGKAAGELPVEPNYTIETSPGNGQPAWLFDRALPPAEARPLAAALRRATGSDAGTADICHVWRVSGTLNWPGATKLARGRSPDPAPVTIAAAWDGSFTSVEDLRTALEPWAAVPAAAEPVALGELPTVDCIEVSPVAAEMLLADDVEKRSEHAARVVEQLGFDGLTAEQACAVFLSATGNWFARYEGKDPVADFTRLWGKYGAHHAEERAHATNVAEIFSGSRAKTPPPAANDNKPTPALSIFDWTADRFVGAAPPVEYLVDGVIPMGVPGMVSAAGDTGKSYALLELHRRIAFGSTKLASPIFGGRVVAEGTSVMITSEDDANEVHRRVAALDDREQRYTAAGKRMIIVPLPSAGGARAFWREDRKRGLLETDDFRSICDQLLSISDLRLVTFDPLASFAHLPLNEDPTAGQFVCSSLARLASETKATVLVAHHMRKSKAPIETLSDAREAIRGSTALVDGLRLAYAMWPADEARAKRICKSLGIGHEPNKIVLGGVVKANGAARRIMSTYARNESGLLVDRTAGLGAAAPAQGDLRAALVISVEAAAAAGTPFSKTGSSGLFELRERLPEELRRLGKARLVALATDALERGEIVRVAARGEKTAKWLDAPTGMFAAGIGTFTAGMPR